MSDDLKALLTVKASDLQKSAEADDAWDYLFHFTDKYLEAVTKYPEAVQEFNDSQLVLLTYNILYGEIMNGGFIQLIINGKAFVFEPPFSETIKLWGAEKTAEIVDKAKIIFEKNKEELLRGEKLMVDYSEARGKITDKDEAELLSRKTAEEHSKIYNSIVDFEPLEDEFYDCADEETAAIKKYVQSNAEKFATII
ncbi:MAG: DMP19 family protein [Oscillospiraceae bacterium]|nr:DMP19 family protein [Oscillospiraceae bacterium]